MPQTTSLFAFFSWSHEEAKLKEELVTHQAEVLILSSSPNDTKPQLNQLILGHAAIVYFPINGKRPAFV